MSGNSTGSDKGGGVRPGQVLLAILLTLLGVAIVYGGWQIANGLFNLAETDAGYWAGTLANIGTTLFLAIVLVVFEQRIVGRVEKKAEEIKADTEQSVGEVRETVGEVREAVGNLRTNIDDLNDLLADRKNARSAQHEVLAESITADLSREAILELLSTAARRRAIAQAVDDDGKELEESGAITVRAGDSPDAPFISFRCFTRRVPSGFIILAHGAPATYVWWNEQESAADVLDQLTQKMIAHDLGAGVRALDAKALFINLATALLDALKSRDADPDAWITSTPLREVFADGWAVTATGIEARGHGLVIADSQFSHWSTGTPGSSRIIHADVGPVPEGLSPDLWALAEERGSKYFHARLPGR